MAAQKLNDTWFRIAGMPVIAVMGHLIFFNRNVPGNEDAGIEAYILSLVETMVLWEANRLVIWYFRNRYPDLQQTRKRLSLVLTFCILITIIVRSLNLLVYDLADAMHAPYPLDAYLQNILIALLFVVIIVGMYEAIYYFRKWKDIAVETEALKKENLQTQLNSLKAQINPHFLFNSLGSLSSLIDENPAKAQQFVGEMSTVYRYLLQANEKQLTTLRDELYFIQAYSHMLMTRFPSGLQLNIQIDDRCLDYLLPPLTLQLLLENAVKHNAVLPTKPLHIKVWVDKEHILKVQNNLQKKTSQVPSNKTALNNIIAKQKLLNHPNIVITQTSTDFTVSVPLVKTYNHASTDSGR